MAYALRAQHRYNGLNWRIEKVADTPSGPVGVSDGTLDQKRSMYYSANWQMLEEYIDDDTNAGSPDGVDRRMAYVWGARYIDDIALRMLDSDADDDYDTTYYHLTDAMFSTMAILDSSHNVLERVSYDPYGKARHHKRSDMNGDGTVNVADQNIVIANWGSAPAPGDIDRNGAVGTPDLLAVSADWGSGLALGRLSSTDNVIGWCGYVFNAEISGGGNYKVRFREYVVDLGRWAERDSIEPQPLDLYEYADSDPISLSDPDGRDAKGEKNRKREYQRKKNLANRAKHPITPQTHCPVYRPLPQPIPDANPLPGEAIALVIEQLVLPALAELISEYEKTSINKCIASGGFPVAINLGYYPGQRMRDEQRAGHQIFGIHSIRCYKNPCQAVSDLAKEMPAFQNGHRVWRECIAKNSIAWCSHMSGWALSDYGQWEYYAKTRRAAMKACEASIRLQCCQTARPSQPADDTPVDARDVSIAVNETASD